VSLKTPAVNNRQFLICMVLVLMFLFIVSSWSSPSHFVKFILSLYGQEWWYLPSLVKIFEKNAYVNFFFALSCITEFFQMEFHRTGETNFCWSLTVVGCLLSYFNTVSLRNILILSLRHAYIFRIVCPLQTSQPKFCTYCPSPSRPLRAPPVSLSLKWTF
jgi:hypothetical protein